MTPPYAQRGQPISPSAFNALIDMVKSSQLTSVVGGTFSRSIGGTTLTIGQQSSGGGRTSGSKCWFQLSDASEGNELKIEIAQDQIAGRYPQGMGLGFAPYKITITANTYFYISVKYNTTTLEIDTADDAIQIVDSTQLEVNTTEKIFILIGTAVVKNNAINKVESICDQPIPSPCYLAWEPETPPPTP
jgi:hypothetical protein